MRRLFLTIIVLLLSSCASRQVYELPKVQRSLAENMVKTEGLVQKATNDYREKKALYDNIAKSNSAAFRDADADLGQSLRQMFDRLQEVNAAKKEMTEASGDVASLSYQRAHVYGDEKEYPLVSDALKRFEDANTRLNQALMNYSRESNTMADTIASKKLYAVFDVAEFQKRLQKANLNSQEVQKAMQKELLKAEGYINNWTKPSGQPEAEAIFEEMKNVIGDYSNHAQTLAAIAKEMQIVSLGKAKVNSLEQPWPEVQKLAASLDTTEAEMNKLNEKFSKKNEDFRKSR